VPTHAIDLEIGEGPKERRRKQFYRMSRNVDQYVQPPGTNDPNRFSDEHPDQEEGKSEYNEAVREVVEILCPQGISGDVRVPFTPTRHAAYIKY